MIRSLQKRLTLLVLCFLLVILAGVVFAINYVNWMDLTEQAKSSLDVLVRNDGRRPGMMGQGKNAVPRPWELDGEYDDDLNDEDDLDNGNDYEDFIEDDWEGPPVRPMDPERNEPDFAANLSTFYVIRLDAEKSVLHWSSDRQELYTDTQIEDLTRQVVARGKDFGRIGSQFYRWQDKGDSSLLVVLDARMEISRAKALLKTTVLTGILAYLILSITAALLIRRMTRPVQEAFDKQKQFVWDASHELKTPLAVISANAEVLAGEIGENEWLRYIQSEVERTNHLVENLLTLARMDKGSIQMEFHPFDLSQAVLQVALPFESTVFEAGKTMKIDVPEGIQCRGDQNMLQQLVVILLSNAVKYSDDGGEIALSLSAKGPSLSVHNTGPVITPDVLPHIFDRFYRGDAAHNRETPGNGLGLAIAKTIVEAHHGRIVAESSQERGTTFTVTLS